VRTIPPSPPPQDLWPGVRLERPPRGLDDINDAEEDAWEYLGHLVGMMQEGRAANRALDYDAAGQPRPSLSLLRYEAHLFGWVTDVHRAAEWLRLPGGHRNWKVDLIIAGGNRFYCHGAGDWYLDGKGFLDHADRRDLANVDLVQMARRAAKAEDRRVAALAERRALDRPTH
jgi:hypothetical protein